MTAKLTLDEKVMMAIPTMTDEQLAMTKNFIRAEERKRGTFRRTARKARAEVLVSPVGEFIPPLPPGAVTNWTDAAAPLPTVEVTTVPAQGEPVLVGSCDADELGHQFLG